MDSSVILTIGAGCVIGLIVWLLFLRPADREFESQLRESFERQAAKRGGSVSVSDRRPTLSIRHEGTTIELSADTNNEELWRDHVFARFRFQDLADKDVKVLLDSKDPLDKPIVFGDRVQFADEPFQDTFITSSNDEKFAQDLLTPDIRERLRASSLQLQVGPRTDSYRLSRDRGWVSVFTRGLRSGDDLYDAMIETAIMLFDRSQILK